MTKHVYNALCFKIKIKENSECRKKNEIKKVKNQRVCKGGKAGISG